MSNNCYICGASPADQPLSIKETFTAHNRCKSPKSDKLCKRCYDCLEGQYKQCWYYKEDENQVGKWSKLWGRNWSWLISESESFPKFSQSPFNDGILEGKELPTRALIREWILNPPNPPFTIALAESGHKHTYPFAEIALNNKCFPVLLEETLIYWNSKIHPNLLKKFETLHTMGFSKAEIMTGLYSHQKLYKVDRVVFYQNEDILKPHRNTPVFKLLSFISI